jgi:hypothetical protein
MNAHALSKELAVSMKVSEISDLLFCQIFSLNYGMYTHLLVNDLEISKHNNSHYKVTAPQTGIFP